MNLTVNSGQRQSDMKEHIMYDSISILHKMQEKETLMFGVRSQMVVILECVVTRKLQEEILGD